MNCGTILLIEDSEAQRMALQHALEMRGFKVEGAGDVETARMFFEILKEQIDVLVTDIRLEDPTRPEITGIDLVVEFFTHQSLQPPEIVILSAYSLPSYYRSALDVRAAVYLDKSECGQDDLIRHIRALTIRRMLSTTRLEIIDMIGDITKSNCSRSDAVVRFCIEGLEYHFNKRLGAPFIFLLTDGCQTNRIAGVSDLLMEVSLYETIQEMVYSDDNTQTPVVLNSEKLQAMPFMDIALLKQFDGAAFFPLIIARDLRLTLGILRDDSMIYPLSESPIEMATVLAKHLEPVLYVFRATVNAHSGLSNY